MASGRQSDNRLRQSVAAVGDEQNGGASVVFVPGESPKFEDSIARDRELGLRVVLRNEPDSRGGHAQTESVGGQVRGVAAGLVFDDAQRVPERLSVQRALEPNEGVGAGADRGDLGRTARSKGDGDGLGGVRRRPARDVPDDVEHVVEVDRSLHVVGSDDDPVFPHKNPHAARFFGIHPIERHVCGEITDDSSRHWRPNGRR